MTTIQFLGEWTLRSSLLILSGALLLRVLRVRDASTRCVAWAAMLAGSLAIPALTAVLPKLPLALAPVMTAGTIDQAPPVTSRYAEDATVGRVTPLQPFDWARMGLIAYSVVALALLLRLFIGLLVSLRLLRNSRSTGQTTELIEIREYDRFAAPVTLGILRPVIVVPADWRDWSSAKLDAVLAHERSHVRRFDPALQTLSAIHRALLWHSPLSWFLHQRIVRSAEDASDDAAMAATQDRASYAEVLLDFMRHGVRRKSLGVAMARYGSLEARIQRILDAAVPSRGISRWGVAAILAVGSPLAYLVAAVHTTPRQAQQIRQATPPPAQQAQPAAYLNALGTVTAVTVTVRPRIDGQLMSLDFKEGDRVEAGQLLASIDPLPDLAQVVPANYTQIRAPITGIAGLRLVDPGNLVHASDATGIVTINQLQPISVVFNLPEDTLPQARALLRNGTGPQVEVWSRDSTLRIATGRLTAIDNQIDTTTGTARLKAAFDNQDGALFPNQFVNVRLLLNTQ